MPKLDLLHSGTSEYGWELSRVAIASALVTLEIELPVIVRWFYPHNPKDRHLRGSHNCLLSMGEPTHIIKLNTFLMRDQISETLWHELAHAQQTEQAAREVDMSPLDFTEQIYMKSKGGLGVEYLNNHFEVAARKVANDHKHKELLA